jgi:hypothetical protein
MRLKMSLNAADELLVAAVNAGYEALENVKRDKEEKQSAGTYDVARDHPRHQEIMNNWATGAVNLLDAIFPTHLELNTFKNPEMPIGFVPGGEFGILTVTAKFWIRGLDKIRTQNLLQYTDLPIQSRYFVEDIDSFRKVRDVNPRAVSDLLKANGLFEKSENDVQLAFEKILAVPMHKEDWGGEINDLYTTNIVINNARTDAAFLLKGNGLRKAKMEIADCGKNGDQLLRLTKSPARLLVVQFVGQVSEAVIDDIAGKVRDLTKQRGEQHHYCIIDGQDTARLMRAYGMVYTGSL